MDFVKKIIDVDGARIKLEIWLVVRFYWYYDEHDTASLYNIVCFIAHFFISTFKHLLSNNQTF